MGRAPCCEKVGLKKGRWTAEEDEKLLNYIKANGEGSWRSLPKNAGLLRCGKSCRLRWINYLREDVKRGNISADEEETIIKLHSTLGNRWSLIAGHLPGRTDNEIKNYWNSHLSRRIHTFRRFPAAAAAPADVFSSNKRKGGRTSRSNMKKKPEIILVRKSKTATSASNSSSSNPSASITTAATDTSTGMAVLEGGGYRQLGLDEEHLSELLCWEGGDVDHEEGMHATSSASEEGNSAVALMGSATADSGAVGLDGADAVGEESVYGGWWGLDDLDLEVDMGVEPMPMQAWDEGRVDDGELEFLSLESLGTWLLSDDM